MSQCRSCKAEILWVTMEKSLKKNPLDPEPVPNGNIVIMTVSGSERTARGVGAREAKLLAEAGTPLYVSHFVSCRDSKIFRKDDREPAEERQ